VPRTAIDGLRAAGFTTHRLPPRDDGAGHAQVVRLEAAGTLTAATDPRADGTALTGRG
jgi:gamma-glutamyltranspeptidase/glutathione hydrolase